MEEPRKYKLAGGDGGCYGPEFGPVLAEEMLEVKGEGASYLMLRLEKAINFKNEKINYFVVSPRYAGDTLKKLRKRGCTVGVGRVLPGQEVSVQTEGVSNKTVEYWSIGSCIPQYKKHNKWLQWMSALSRRHH